jgi:hypothetical protein
MGIATQDLLNHVLDIDNEYDDDNNNDDEITFLKLLTLLSPLLEMQLFRGLTQVMACRRRPGNIVSSFEVMR